MVTIAIFFVSGRKIINFKAKSSEIVPYPLSLGDISKDFNNKNMSATGLNGYVHDFSVDYNAIKTSDVLDIHKYFMKKII